MVPIRALGAVYTGFERNNLAWRVRAGLVATLSLHQYSVFQWYLLPLENTLGGLTNYWLGFLLPNPEAEKYGHKAQYWLSKYGYWSLLFSWLPVISDPLVSLRVGYECTFGHVYIDIDWQSIRYSLTAVLRFFLRMYIASVGVFSLNYLRLYGIYSL